MEEQEEEDEDEKDEKEEEDNHDDDDDDDDDDDNDYDFWHRSDGKMGPFTYTLHKRTDASLQVLVSIHWMQGQPLLFIWFLHWD